MERLAPLILPDPVVDASAEAIEPVASMLDRALVENPTVALASTKRELLRMGETVAAIYHPVMELMDGGNLDKIARVRALDDEVNRKYTDIKLFIAEVHRGKLTERESKLGSDLTNFSINLEYIGDIIAKSLVSLAEERAKKASVFARRLGRGLQSAQQGRR